MYRAYPIGVLGMGKLRLVEQNDWRHGTATLCPLSLSFYSYLREWGSPNTPLWR